jgi:hypothetical protein
MTSHALFPTEIDAAKIEFGNVKLLPSGGKAVNLSYQSRDLMVEVPSLSIPYGVNIYDKEGPDKLKYSIDLSLRGADENPKVRELQDFLEAFDERMIDAGVENGAKWFKMANPSREVIKAFYTPLVKISRDPQGNPKPYPPTFKLSLRQKAAKKNKDGMVIAKPDGFDADVYDNTTGEMTAVTLLPSNVEQTFPKRSQLTTIIQCTGVWFAGSKFGTTWKLRQARIDSQPEQIRGPAFRTEAPDIRAFVSKSLPAVAQPEEEVEDEGGEDVMAAVLPPAKPAPSKPAAKPAAAPAPPAFEEDEAVMEAVPAPAAVKKLPPKKPTKKAA